MNTSSDDFLPTRKSLLTRLKNWDDQESWREFFDTYWKLIFSAARKTGLTHAEAEDVVQETVMAVARKIRNFHYDPALGSFKAWLMLIVRSRIADYLRKQCAEKRRRQPLPEPGTDLDVLASRAEPALDRLDAVWDEEWRKNLLATAVERIKAKVSAKQFLLFDLYVLKGTPIRKITRALDVNAGQVYLAKHRISRLLKAEMEKLEDGMDCP